MHSYFKKNFSFFLFGITCIFLSAYTMEDIAPDSVFITTNTVIIDRRNANKALLIAIDNLYAENFQEKNWKNISDCLENGANPNIMSANRKPLLALAIKHKQQNVVDTLLQCRADINYQNNSAFMQAINDRNIDIIKLLISKNANVNLENLWGFTPLKVSIKKGDFTLVNFLINNNANINQKDKATNSTPIKFSITNKNVAIVKKLCNSKALLDNINDNNDNVFHVACLEGSSRKMFKTILIYGYPYSHNKIVNDKKYDELKEKIMITFYIFRQNKLPLEIQAIILSEILSEDDLAHNKIHAELLYNSLYKKLEKNDEQRYILTQLKNHLLRLESLLQQKNNNGKTAREILFKSHQNDQNYINNINSLISISELYKNYGYFNQKFPIILHSNNLICKIYNNIKLQLNSS